MFDKMKIRTKQIVLITVMLIFSILIGLFGLRNLKVVNGNMDSMYKDRVEPLQQLKAISDAYAVFIVDATHKVRNGNFSWTEAKNSVTQAQKTISEKWNAYLGTKIEGKELELVNQAKELIKLANDAANELEQIIGREDRVALEDFVKNKLYQSIDPLTGKLSELIDIQLTISKQINVDSNLLYAKTQRNAYILFLLSFVISITIGYYIIKSISNILKSLLSETKLLTDAAVQGNLSVRGDPLKINQEFREIITGFNSTIEAIVTPLNVAAGYISNIGKGIIPEKITASYSGDFDVLKNNINQCVAGMQGLVEANRILQKMSLNDYTEKIDNHFLGIYSDVCTAVNLVNDRVIHVIEICQRISEGDLSDREDLMKIGRRSENDKLMPSIILMSDSIINLIIDTNSLAAAAVEGKLSVRADASRHHGDYGKVIAGINDTLDAVVGPLNVAAEYVSRISIGDMPPVITEKYNGDFNVIINNLNALIIALNDVIAKAKLVADGDLTVDLMKRSEKDELMKSLTEMVKSTANIISEFKSASDNISSSSQQMSSTSQQMSQGASEQASSAEEVSSSMEEMAANIQQNTENARQTEKIALNASDGINRINDASDQTLKYMQDIADKVSIIGEIARQTNILALNAAVEAARAGEHGKGFAVVAAEVRKLAERSQVSAVEIDTLTKNSVRATEESGKLLAAIAPEIGKTAKLVQEIAAASIEQNSGADQVNNAIQQLNQVTQQNAAASEEMATSSEELAGQAQQLLEMISFFKIESKEKAKRSLSAVDMSKPSHPNVAHIDKFIQKPHPETKKTNKGVIINMGKDNLDSNYEKF